MTDDGKGFDPGGTNGGFGLKGMRDRVGQVGGTVEVASRARTGGFDVILMDLRMPGGDGVAATEHILAADPGARVLILTTYETDADILRAVEAGGPGRDRARSLTNAEIGQALFISEATVKTHLLRAFGK